MKAERIVTIIFLIIIAGAIFYFAGKYVIGLVSNKNDLTLNNLQKAYASEIASQNDVNKLTDDGVKLVKGNQLDCGIINLTRATEIEPRYRDAWVWLGFAQIKNNEPQEAIISLKKAAEIDPIHADTFKYLVIAYEQVGNSEQAKIAQERYDFLTKNK